MIYLLLYFIAWLLAGFFNSVMDAIDLHPLTNIFPKKKFYRVSPAGWRPDCWHLSKWFMLLFFAISGFLLFLIVNINLIIVISIILISGLSFGLIHDLFFHHIFLKKD